MERRVESHGDPIRYPPIHPSPEEPHRSRLRVYAGVRRAGSVSTSYMLLPLFAGALAQDYFESRSRRFFVIRVTAGSSPRRPWAQSVVPEVKTVPPPGEV